jgi:endonuclease/exonuclease/phosphatase family metal-dependent hydrolase
MSSGHSERAEGLAARLEWAAAGGLAGWAAARLTGADRLRPLEATVVPLLSFTPQAAAGACLGALLLRGRGASATAALAAAALTATVVPRAIPRRQPAASGAVLRVLTANLLIGRACADTVVELVRSTRADVLFLQEVTDDAVTRLDRAGLGELLPNQITEVSDGALGSGIWARYPLSDGLALAPTSVAQPSARLRLPSGRSVHLVCVHLRPPNPRFSRHAVPRWRREMSVLPPPEDPPVILAGDFNSTLDHAQFRRLLRLGHVDAARQAGRGLIPTWGPEPRGRPALLAIDHVLIDPRCAVRATSVHRLPGSDHRAVFAEIRLPG